MLVVQVVLEATALPTAQVGNAARVQADSHEVQLQQGVAVFDDILINANAGGEYNLRFTCVTAQVHSFVM